MQLKSNQINELYNRAITFSVRRGFSYQDAEDIAQNTMIKLVLSAAEYEPDRPFLPWFYTIIRTVSIDYYRSAMRQCKISDAVAVQLLSPDADASEGEELDPPEIGLFSLNKEQRKLVKLRIAGHSYKEIAAKMNKSPAALRKQYERAINALRVIHTSASHR